MTGFTRTHYNISFCGAIYKCVADPSLCTLLFTLCTHVKFCGMKFSAILNKTFKKNLDY